MARLILPEDFESQFKLAKLINDKHIADGAGSRLNAYLAEQGFLLSDIVTDGGIAETHEKNRAQLRRDSENNKEKRDNTFNPVWKQFTGSVQFLKALFKPQYHKLGDWGVNTTGI